MTDKPSPRPLGHICAGWEVVCPDGKVRGYPFHNEGDAESWARLKTERQCLLYPKPSPHDLEEPRCPEGHHTYRAIVFSHADEPSNEPS